MELNKIEKIRQEITDMLFKIEQLQKDVKETNLSCNVYSCLIESHCDLCGALAFMGFTNN